MFWELQKLSYLPWPPGFKFKSDSDFSFLDQLCDKIKKLLIQVGGDRWLYSTFIMKLNRKKKNKK